MSNIDHGLTRGTAWTRLPGTHRPRVYLERTTATILPNGQARVTEIYAWKCEEHERSMGGYKTIGDAMDAAGRHYSRRH